ncbi:MAG: class I SAM-dependent methyltransferase [Roseibium sp.]
MSSSETEANGLPNFDLREEIKEYWGRRAETFDSQPGHEIFSEAERSAWHGLLLRHLGPGEGRQALDLACGTGVISHLLDDLGFDVSGLDWAEPMLERARAKARTRQRTIRFVVGDAERTLEPDASADVLTCRHLVWTLVDPPAAFREWLRILKPGGRLLIVDGDFVNPGPVARLTAALPALWRKLFARGAAPAIAEQLATHRSILARVHFSGGARAEEVAELLREAGFADIRVDARLGAIHRAQSRNFPALKALDRATQHRYAISAVKPADET